jgi:6-phosphogluconolactonase
MRTAGGSLSMRSSRLGRRQFVTLMGGAMAASTASVSCAPAAPAPTAFYAAVSADLGLYAVDDKALTLARQSEYAWVHPTLPVMYVAYSNRSTTNNNHGVAVYGIDRASGHLTELARPLTLDNRPIHLSVHPMPASTPTRSESHPPATS